VRILTETVTSPTIKAQAEALKKAFPEFVWHKYDAVGRENTRAAAKQAFGDDVEPIYDFSKAEVVVALDSNFFVDDPGSMRYANDYLKLRRVRGVNPADPAAEPGQPQYGGTSAGPRMTPGNRLFAIESTPTLVGAMADHKLRVRPDEVHQFAAELYQAVSGGGSSTTAPAGGTAAKAPWFAKLVQELQAHKGKSIVVAGEYAAPEVHLLAHAINNALGNIAAEPKTASRSP
jgi:molybdopterin-containing oxidoreductase family iron-sulfur binding subunit